MKRAWIEYHFWKFVAWIDDNLHSLNLDNNGWAYRFCQWSSLGFLDISEAVGSDDLYFNVAYGWPLYEENKGV